MKKLVLATAIATVASFNASADVTIGGELEARYNSAVADGTYFKDAEVVVAAEYEIAEGVTASAEITIEDTLSNVMGFDFGAVSVAYGATDNAHDGFGVETAIAGPGGTAFSGYSDEVLVVSGDFGPVSVVASNNEEGEGTDLLVSTSIETVDLQFGYQDTSDDTFGVAATFDAGVATVGIDYTTNDATDVMNLIASVPLAETTTATVGLVTDDTADTTGWYANVAYKFPMAKSVKLYSEIFDTDAAGSDTEFVAGIEIAF